MKRITRVALLLIPVAALSTLPSTALGCAACYGQSDAPMAHGMNWGIMSLLVVIGSVLATLAGFFVYLARRAASMEPGQPVGELAGANERI